MTKTNLTNTYTIPINYRSSFFSGIYQKSNRSETYRQPPPKDSADDLYGIYGNSQNKLQNHHSNHSRSEYVYRWTPPNSVMHEYS